jgi:hypothetical protein
VMKTSRTELLSVVCALLSHANVLVAQDACAEGVCQGAENSDTYLLCASQNWHTMPSNGYVCVSGLLVPPAAGQTSILGSSPIQTNSPLNSTQTTPVDGEQPSSPVYTSGVHRDLTSSITSTQTQSTSIPQAWRASQDSYGTRSYIIGGKMASVYDSDSSSSFRCDDVAYPHDGYYVAFYTQYDSTLEAEERSQPAPINCGQYVNFTNPLTSVSEIALVLDRCASCIGVGGQLNDPNTDQSLVNGATVDFSRALWNKIYNNAPNNVYDIQYTGKTLQGMP